MSMNMRVSSRPHNPHLEGYACERMGALMERCAQRFSEVDFQLDEGELGQPSEHKTCTIDARLVPRGTVHVQVQDQDIYAAVVKAVHQLETDVLTMLYRGRQAFAVRRARGVVPADERNDHWDAPREPKSDLGNVSAGQK